MDKAIAQLYKKFREIKKLGYIKSIRKGSAGIGATFETLLGKNEENFEARLLKKFTKIIVNDYSSLLFWYNRYIKKNGDNNVKND